MNNPFEKLNALRDQLPPGKAPEPPRSPLEKALKEKIVVRMERKGHGGKTVTRVSGLNLPKAAKEDVVRSLKKALGCGASVDGDDVLLQGDIVERVAQQLEKMGASKVVRG